MPRPKKSPDTPHKTYIELSPDMHARIARGAKNDDRTVNKYVQRFVVANIDLLDPEGAEAQEEAEVEDE